ncbi:VOC family protein [Desulfosporosinus sp. OT]|uniref:VOC family protein n=1 Tax=Desulfosporosinus sp. OT TaxID=913865 RepID=UPI000223B24A|nr:VOC family protein [Desulfosporosinus sp. OT]EGW38810.1 glyoxalase/Bleomycin resistance /Dioxygenase superfamily protein [Desulfosporosinus sp. OT]
MSHTEQAESKKYNTVSIWLTTKSTNELIIFLKAAFNAKELGRVYNPDGSIGHAEVQIGDSKILMFDSKPEWPAVRSFIHLYVENGDELYEQALKAGAKSMTKMTTHFWGDRGGRVIDPFGNVWWINSHFEDVSAEEMESRSKQKEFIEAMAYAQKSFNPFLSTDY